MDRDDIKHFNKKDWRGTYLPWNGDKAYTLLEEGEDNPEKIVATPESDPEKRQKGLQLREEIRDIFK